MFKRVVVAALIASLVLPVAARAEGLARPQTAFVDPKQNAPAEPDEGRLSAAEKAAIIAALIAAYYAYYQTAQGPCACPYHRKRDGKTSCGGNSAYNRAGGYRPLCFPTDITPAIFQDWFKNKKLPIQ